MTETENEPTAGGGRRRRRLAFGPGELRGWSPEISGSAHGTKIGGGGSARSR